MRFQTRFQNFIFFILLFSIPFQKRIFLFGPGTPLTKEFFEWSSAFVYFTDFLVALLAFFWLAEVLRKISLLARLDAKSLLRALPRTIRCGALPLVLFLGFAFLSLTQAELIDAGVYRFVKLTEFIFLFFYVTSAVTYNHDRDDTLWGVSLRKILSVFVASGVFQSMLAILQFAKQSSLGLEIFHESTLAIGMKGVAHIAADGASLIRAYGTFPSPNVLAAFLAICLFFAFALFLRVPEGKFKIATQGICGIAIAFLSFGLLLTFSRGVIMFFLCTTLLYFIGLFLLKQFRGFRGEALRLIFVLISAWALLAVLVWPEISSRVLRSSYDEPAIQERLFFNEVGINTVRQNYSHLFFGVGMGNFVNEYMRSVPNLPAHLYQPVHNIFILILSEIGVLGLLSFILFLVLLVKKSLQFFFSEPYAHDRGNNVIVFSLLLIPCFLFLIALYDHYFWTIQQGSLMFWITFGLIASVVKFFR